MANDLSIQAEVAVNAEKAEAAFDRVGDKATQMAAEVAGAAGKAGQAIDGIGSGAEKSADRFTRSEARMRDAIKKSTQELQLLGKTASEKLEFNIAAKGLDAGKFAPYIAELKQAEAAQRVATGSLDKMGISAAQTAAALRQVPAQFTDIIVSLQSGQAPLTVLLQQGGQLKDMFGGVGNAARALGGYAIGLVNPFTIAAAAVAGVAVAYKQGSAEADGYRAALITTGNAAGATAAQMQQMAARIGAVVGTQGAAADALAQMAASGRVAAQHLEYFGEVALKTEKSIGTAVSETVKQFAELGKSPVEASRKLNEETNYLTASIYEQIKALKDQGRDADAAALAQKTYADALNGRSAQMTQNLGVIEKAWQGITGAAKGAWDAMLNVGRQDTLATKMDDVRAKIAQAQGQDKNRPFSLPWDTPLAELQQQLEFLSEEDRMLRRGAEAQAARTQAEKDAIAAADALQKTQEKGLTKQQQMNKALEEYRRQLADLRATNPDSELLSSKAVVRGEKAIRDQFKETGSGAAGVGQSEVAGIRARTIEMERYLELLRAHGAEAEKMTEGEKLVIRIQEELKTSISGVARAEKEKALAAAQSLASVDRQVASEQSRQKALKESEAALNRQIDTVRKQADSVQDQAIAQESVNANMGKSKTAVEQATLAQLKLQQAESDSSDRFAPAYVAALAAKTEAQQRYVKALQDAEYLQKSTKLTEAGRLAAEEAETLELQLSLLGRSQLERDRIIAQRQVEVRLAKELAEIEKLNLGEGPEADAKRAELRARAQANAVVEANNAANKAVLDEWQRTADSINQSLTDALLRGFESGKDFAKNLRDTVVNMFKTMVLRPVISAIVNPVAGAITGALGLSGAAQAGQSGGGNAASMAMSGASLFGAGGMAGSLAAGAGWLTGATTLGGSLTAGASLLGTGTMAGAASGMGMIAGALGPIAIGIALLSSLIKKSTPHMGAGSTYSADGGLVTGKEQYAGYGFADTRTYSKEAETVTSTISRGVALSLDKAAVSFGQKAGFSVSTAFADDKSKDGAWGSFAISKDGKKLLDWRDTQTSKWAPREFADGEEGLKQYQAEIAKSMRGALDEMDLPGWANEMLDAVGDSPSIEGITATVDAIAAAKTSLDSMGRHMVGFSSLTDEAVTALVKASGGMDSFVAAAGSYYQNFYSDAERAAAVQRDVATELEAVGLKMPRTREEFRAMVEEQMALGASGAAAVAVLLQVSGAFASVTAAAEDAASAIAQQREAMYSALERAVAAEKRVLQSQLSVAQEVAGTLGGLFGILHDSVRELHGEVESTRSMQARQGNEFIAQALATARSTGYLPDADQLTEAIRAARGDLDVSNYGGSTAERDYAALVLAGSLSGLEEVAGKQLTDAQRTVRELETQTEQLDQTLDYWRQQIDIASGTYEGVLSVAAAVDRLSASLSTPAAAAPGGAAAGGGGDVGGPAYRDRGTVPRVDYGADVALTSFDKFKAWYQGHATNANVAALQSSGYQVPDWMRVSHAPSTDDEMFGAYLFFKNNPQFATDFEQVMTTGRSSMPTDGSTLVRSDLSKMPSDAADFFANDRNSLLSYEAFGLDPVLAYRLYKDGPEQFGLDIRRENFTEWLRTHMWTPDGIVESNNTLDSARPYDGYKLPRWDTSTGNIVDLDGRIYSPDGRLLGTASRDMMASIYGSAFIDTSGGVYGDAAHSALYNSQVGGGKTEADYYAGIRSDLDAAIAGGRSAQELADSIAQSGASMADVAMAYGITVAQLEENLRNGGATNIPKFAVGTNYVPHDMLAYIHEGEAVVPKAYNPAAHGWAGGGDTARLEALIEKLTAEVAELKAAANATADNTGKSAGVLVAVQRGNSLSQVAEPTF